MTRRAASEIAGAIAEALDYVGVLGVEMFYLAGRGRAAGRQRDRAARAQFRPLDHGRLRSSSQFENHIRAVAGWPLGPTERHSDAVMTNLIGDDVDGWQPLAAEPDTALHLYGKREARPGRKMGHVNRAEPRR